MGMNSQLHLTLETQQLDKLRVESERLEISVSELIRRKLEDKPTSEEIIVLRKLRSLMKK